MKRILASMVAVAAVWGGVSFADVQVDFYNELYSDDPFLQVRDDNKDGDWESEARFPGIKERMYADIKTAKVDAGVKGTLYFGQDWGANHCHLSGEINDWWVEFRPIDIITLGLHDTIWADGSYFPIWDDNATAGNIGSDGFTFVIRPIKMLRLSATVPSGMDYEVKKNQFGGGHNFHFGTGAILDLDMFQASVNMQCIPCSVGRQFGTFINMPGFFGVVKALSIGAGFTHAWGYEEKWNQNYLKDLIADFGMAYTNLLNTYVTYDARLFRLNAELAWDFDFDDNAKGYDFYTAVAFSFGLVDKLSATATGKLLFDFADNGLGNGYGASFAVDYEINKRHAVGAKAEVNKVDKYWDFAIPVYWKYSLAY